MDETTLEFLLKRDRFIVLTALVAITALAWVYILRLAADMQMGGMDMTGFRMVSTGLRMGMAPASRPWSHTDFLLMFAMWAVMMVGMMTPSVAPLILLYARVARQAETQGRAMATPGWFLVGYMVAWILFALAATVTQRALDAAALLTPDMHTANRVYAGAVLIVAGFYQLSSVKEVCLEQCQSPLDFLRMNGGFRRTALGSCALGLRHGLYCVGCCWVLMLLLFVGGVMALPWIAAIAILVFAERVLPGGRTIASLAGVGLLGVGIYVLVR